MNNHRFPFTGAASATPWTQAELLTLARRQRSALRLLLIGIPIATVCTLIDRTDQVDKLLELSNRQSAPGWGLTYFLAAVGLLLGSIAALLTLLVLQLVIVYRLAKAGRSRPAWLYLVLAFVPYVNLGSLYHLSRRASKILQAHGIRVGLLGARLSDFDEPRQPVATAPG